MNVWLAISTSAFGGVKLHYDVSDPSGNTYLELTFPHSVALHTG